MKTRVRVAWYVIFLLFSLLLLYPIFFAISNSFKTMAEAFATIMQLIPRAPTLENYLHLFTRLDVAGTTLNTLLIASVVTTFQLLTSILAAYALVFMDFRFKNTLYFILISTIFIPFTVVIVPNFITITRLGFLDNPIGVMLPQLSNALGIFLIRQTMRMIPVSLVEYSRLENLSHLRIMKDIVIPLSKPGIISTGIIFFVNSWNEFVWPSMILRTTENYTLPLALQRFISAEAGHDFTYAMALSVVSMVVPIALFLFFQRHVISTFVTSGVKG